VVIEDGAYFKGNIDIVRPGSGAAAGPRTRGTTGPQARCSAPTPTCDVGPRGVRASDGRRSR